jgi:hypothetical protein
MPREGYDEGEQLYRYLTFSYGKLLTKLEGEVGMAIIGRAKVQASAEGGRALPPDHHLRTKFACEGVPEIEEALADGVTAHKARVVRRMLEQHGSEIVLNRCPQCNCIVATPLARQCLWCGHNWRQSNKA